MQEITVDMAMTKQCLICKIEKSTGEFYISKKSKDGFGPYCKECHKTAVKLRYAKNPEPGKTRSRLNYILRPEQVKKESQEWYNKNLEKSKDQKKRWSKKNRDKHKRYWKKWAMLHPEECKAQAKRNREKHKPRNIAQSALRKARKLQATPSWADQDAIREIYKEAHFLTQQTGRKYHVDHIVPLRGKMVSGLHVEHNLQILPAIQNMSKGNQYVTL
jgi:hypothetical protein